MSSHGLQPRDALLSTTQKPAVVVQVDELSVASPTAEAAEVLSRRVEVAKTATVAHQDDLEFFCVPVTRCRTSDDRNDASLAVSASSAQRSSSHEVFWYPKRQDDSDASSPSRRRARRMQLPSFRSLGIASSDSADYFGRRPVPERHAGPPVRPSLQSGRAAAQSLPVLGCENNRPFPFSFGNTPLLTPPEDADSIKWNNALLNNPPHPNVGESSGTSQPVTQVIASASEVQPGQPPLPTSSQSGEQGSRGLQHQANQDTDQDAEQSNHGTGLSRAVQPFSEYIMFITMYRD